MKLVRPDADALECGLRLTLVDAPRIGDEAGHSFAMTSDDDLFPTLDVVKEGP